MTVARPPHAQSGIKAAAAIPTSNATATTTTTNHHRAHSDSSLASTNPSSPAPTRTTSPSPPSVATLADLLNEQLGMKRKRAPAHFEGIPLSILEHTHGEKERKSERMVCNPRRRSLGVVASAVSGTATGAESSVGTPVTNAGKRQSERGAGMTESDEGEDDEDEDEDSENDITVVI